MLAPGTLAVTLLLLCLALRSADAEAGRPAPAPSPSVEATRQAADGSFTLGPVANATLLNSTYLRLEGVPATVAWLQYTPQRSAGTLPTGNFTGAERGAGANWLGRHQASLFGTVNGNASVTTVVLSSPVYNAARQRLDLVYEVLEAEPSALPLAGGSVNALVGNYQLGLAAASPAFLVAPEPGTVFTTATLVADTINTAELANGPAVGTRADVIYVIPIGRR